MAGCWMSLIALVYAPIASWSKRMSSLSSSICLSVESAMGRLLSVSSGNGALWVRVNRRLPESRIHSLEEAARVAGRVGFVVVVEVDVDVAAAGAPAVGERGA